MMRSLITVIFCSCLFSIGDAQIFYMEPSTIDYEDDKVETIDVVLEPTVDKIRDKFSDWIDDNYDVGLDGKKLLFFDKEYMTAKGVNIPNVSRNKIDLIVKVEETPGGKTRLKTFASYGYDNWITEYDDPYAYSALNEIVEEFVEDYLPDYYAQEIDVTREKIDELRADIADVQESLNDNQERIDKLQDENVELTTTLKRKKQQVKAAEKNMAEEKAKLDKVNDRVSDMK